MEKVFLKAELRENSGKESCKKIRKIGQVPGIIYKDGHKGQNVRVDRKSLWHAMHTQAGENAIITMEIAGKGEPLEKTVIVQDTQYDPVNDFLLHVDFHEISLTEKLKVEVPVVVKGVPIGVAEEEGVLNQAFWELEVECLASQIPKHIDVYADNLHIGDAIHVKDIKVPEGVVILADPEQVVVSVNLPKMEVEEEAPVETAEEPEVIKKGKKEEEEEAETASAPVEKEKKEKPEKPEKK